MRYWIIIFLLCASFADAQGHRFYQIEVIVFSQMTAQGLRSEYWPPITLPSNPGLDVQTNDSLVWPTAQYRLTRELALLAKNPRYHMVLHQAWLVDMPSLGQAIKLQIKSFQNRQDSIGVLGQIRVDDKHSFHVHWNMTFSVPIVKIHALTPDLFKGSPLSAQQYFQLQQSRNMRSNELHYIDHPLFGIVMEIFSIKASNLR